MERPDLDEMQVPEEVRFPEIINLLKGGLTSGDTAEFDKAVDIVSKMETWEAMSVVADVFIQIRPWHKALFLMGYLTGEMNRRHGTKEMEMITPQGKALMAAGKILNQQAHLDA